MPYLQSVELETLGKWRNVIDLTGIRIAGIDIGRVGFELKAEISPSGRLDLFQRGSEPLVVEGSVRYELNITVLGMQITTHCSQRWRIFVNPDFSLDFMRAPARNFQ
jgi:hypothetical protein